MLPPGSTSLIPRVIAHSARCAREVALRLADFAQSREEREACRSLRATIRSLRGVERAEFYLAPETRGWLTATEEAMDLAQPSEEDLELFERVARGSYLAKLVPKGRIDAAFRRRTTSLGAQMVRRAFRTLPPVVAFLTPRVGRFGPFHLDASADAYEARREGEVHLRFPVPATLQVRRGARLELVDGGIRLRQVGRAARWMPRELIQGTGIVLTRRVISARRGMRPGSNVAGLSERLGEALNLVRGAWPEMHEEVLVHTWEVVPLVERGTVSYSLRSRPGSSYINVERTRRVDLADDLVHETAHHRLHSFEDLAPLHRGDEEAIYYSPWRRSMRPLGGILHAAYTFSFRAELFQRLLRAPGRLPRAWMRREVDRELAMIRRSLVDLDDARDRGLLTRAGSDLVRALSRHVARAGS